MLDMSQLKFSLKKSETAFRLVGQAIWIPLAKPLILTWTKFWQMNVKIKSLFVYYYEWMEIHLPPTLLLSNVYI